MFGLRRQKPGLLGIDISSAAVKLVELSHGETGYRVESVAVAPLVQGAVVDKTLANVEVIGQAIKTVIKASGTRLKHAALAVPTSAVITKTIPMDATLAGEELELQVELEADRYIPYPLDEVSLDFEVLGPSEKSRDMMDVLLVASRRENVDDRVAALDFAGLKAGIVDVESYAIVNAYNTLLDHEEGFKSGRTVAVADVGATMMSLNVIHAGLGVYIREQAFGGKELTEEIQRKYSLSFAEAGLAKKLGSLPENYLAEVLEPFRQALVQQINVALQFFQSSSSHREIDKLILAGGCASIRGIREYAEPIFGIKTEIADPFANMALGTRVNGQTLRNEAPAMMVACGLALRSFDP